jgi:hypothetical protein
MEQKTMSIDELIEALQAAKSEGVTKVWIQGNRDGTARPHCGVINGELHIWFEAIK